MRRSMRGSTFEGIFAMPLVYLNLPANLVVVALLSEGLKLPPDVYGLLVSLPFWCNLLQLFIAPALFGRFRARDIFLVAIWLNVAGWVAFAGVLGLTPNYVREHATAVAGGFIFFAGLTTAIMGVAWTTYTQSWVPDRIRAVYFSQRNRWCQFSNLAFLLLAGFALSRPSLEMFGAVIAASCGLRIISAVYAQRTPAEGDPVPATGASWSEQWARLRGQTMFWRMVVFGMAWGAVLNGFGAFQPVFMLSSLTESAQQASLPLALALLFGALALPAWGRLIERFGARPVLLVAVPLWAMASLPWIFVTRETHGLLYLVWALTGAINAGIVLAQLNLLMKLLPAGAKGFAVGCNIAAAALGTALAPIVGGQLLAWAFARGWTAVSVYHVFFAFMPLCAGLSLLLLRRVREPRSAPVEHVVGALRNVRMLAGTLGLGFLAQELFTPRGKGQKSEY
jgi:MFS family permease